MNESYSYKNGIMILMVKFIAFFEFVLVSGSDIELTLNFALKLKE
jgi:hypothetical protein